LVPGSGEVPSSPAGLSCPWSCKGSFPTGTTVTLTGRPKPGSTLDSWTSSVCREQGASLTTYRGRACTFVMDADKSISVFFVQAPKLDPTATPAAPPAPGPRQGLAVSVSRDGSVVARRISSAAPGV